MSKTPTELNEQFSNAYSYDRYRSGWIPCIRMLRGRGYTDREVEAILRSKWTRRAADQGGKPHGKATAGDLELYMEGVIQAEVDDLVRETFGR